MPRTVYVLTFKNRSWWAPLTEIEGVEIRDHNEDSGVLGIYLTRELAESVGDAWVAQQLQNRIDGSANPPQTEEELWDAQAEHGRGESTKNGVWTSGAYRTGDYVEAEVAECRLLTQVPGHAEEEEEEEEEEEGSDDDDGKEEVDKDKELGGDKEDGESDENKGKDDEDKGEGEKKEAKEDEEQETK